MILASPIRWLQYVADHHHEKVGRRISVARRSVPRVAGIGAFERTCEHGRVFFAVYRFQRDLYFRAGAKRWSLAAPELQFRFSASSDALCSFALERNESPEYRCTYWARGRQFWATINPTYDSLEMEEDHLLYFLSTSGNSPAWRGAAWADQRGHG